jgi:hypothetical protein
MTLTTHAVVGAAAASLVPQYPLLGFALGFGSHFLIDSIPHWNEGEALLRVTKVTNDGVTIRNIKLSKDLFWDIAVVLSDSVIGFVLAVLLFSGLLSVPLYIVLLGAFAGQLPDGLQFVYYTLKPKFMTPLQTFHSRIQTEYSDVSYLWIELGLMALATISIFVLQ